MRNINMIVPNSTFYMMTFEQKKTWHMALGTLKINLKIKYWSQPSILNVQFRCT